MVTREIKTIKFVEEEMVLECKQDGVMVIEANAQGIFDLDFIGRRLQHEFPVVARNFKKLLVLGKAHYGDVVFLEYANFKFAFIINKLVVTNAIEDDVDKVHDITKKAISIILDKGITKLCSGLLETWNKGLYFHITSALPKGAEWVVYKE